MGRRSVAHLLRRSDVQCTIRLSFKGEWQAPMFVNVHTGSPDLDSLWHVSTIADIGGELVPAEVMRARNHIASILVAAASSPWGVYAQAAHPDCAGVEQWPTVMAFVDLKNAGVTDNYKLDFSKTKTVRLASERIGNDLYRQIHYVVFTEKNGATIEVITANDASSQECSMSGVDIFVVARRLGGM